MQAGHHRQTKRRSRLGAWAWAAALAVVAGTGAAPVCAQPRVGGYVATEYAVLHNPGASTVIRRINSAGEVAGAFKVDPRKASAALIFLRGGFETLPGDPGVDYSVAYGINDQSEVVGSYNADTTVLPYRAVRRVGFQALPLLAGDSGGEAYAINARGEAVGYSSGSNGDRAVWWTRAGAVQPLQSPGNASAQALGLNDAGDIVGYAGDDTRRALLWPNKGNPVDLGTLAGFARSEAVSINDRGDIVGFVGENEIDPDRTRAVLWERRGQSIRDLGSLPGGNDSRARDINTRGEIVGTSTSARGNRAFVWTAATGMLDLNGLISLRGLVMTDALSVSSRGQIVVVAREAHAESSEDGHHHDEEHETPRHVIVLTPAP